MAKRVGKTDDQPFVKLFRELTYRWTPWEVWQDFVTMYACAISNAVDKSHFEKREELYLKRIQKYNKKGARDFSSARCGSGPCSREESGAGLPRKYLYGA